MRTVPVDDGGSAAVLTALRAALDGSGPAVRPSLRTSAPRGERSPDEVPDGVALVVETSGSTGEPRAVMLTSTALRASATATDARLGGPAQWLLTLPPAHIAGLQVLARSVLAGTEPVVATAGPFRPDTFAADAARLTGDRRYVSLVPTQLHRLLDDAGAGLAALARFDAVLLGGAAASPSLMARARSAGVRVTTTYGMSETCGGCVYDGVPLDGVRARVDADGRIHLAGPVLAAGYLGRPDLDAATFHTDDGVRWLRTTDAGELHGELHGEPHAELHGEPGDDRLTVLGRLDDVLLTGGAKVAPVAVEALVAELEGVAEVCVVGVPDAEWGHAVTAVVVLRPGARAPALDRVREHVARNLGTPAAPRHLVVTGGLPLRGPGKVDRRAVAELAAQRLA
ncbi:AMP-binding protein [Cellulomonas fimi]|uniref:AMP-binding protein n=1 Tax=Cellulomonas fimi TaxID=1708 RepID=A0A7Y0LV81_CELFI|nr:AMP-binding protein [Cellulomonas fimi]